MRKNHITLAIAVIISAMLACNLPSNNSSQQNPDAILTAAALTVQAQLSANNTPTLSSADTATSAPSANTATFTPIPISTLPAVPSATPTSNCDNALFITDVTYPDNTVVSAGTSFTKTWRLQNTGSCSWTPSYALVFVSDNAMNGPTAESLIGNVNPGQTVDISVNLQAPASNGTYTGNWGLRNASGIIFSHFYVQIIVNSGGSVAFQVTHVSFNVTGSCPNFNMTVTVTTNGAGTVNLHRVFSDSGTDTAPKTLTFSGAGNQTIDYGPVYFGTAHSSEWTDIYIDSPNHQEIGRATFSCP
jgi:Ig-like domain from next to BRCA1 gene